MRTKHLLLFVTLLVGCSTAVHRTPELTSDTAGSLAQQLANEKAQSLYHCQPFQKAKPAQFTEGRWVWHQVQGQGKGDLEATVEFSADGAAQNVTVMQLDSRSRTSGFR